MSNYDPMDYADYGVLSHDSGMMARTDKALKYTGKFDDVAVTGFYSFGRDKDVAPGEIPGDAKSGRQWGLGVNYDAGPFGFGVAYDSLNNPTLVADVMGNGIPVPGSQSYLDYISFIAMNPTVTLNAGSDKSARRIAVGASYNVGPVKLFLGYRNLKTDYSIGVTVPPSPLLPSGFKGAIDVTYKSNLYWTGVKWQATPETVLTAAVHHSQNKDNPNVTSYVLAADYKLSKRTDIYTNLSYMKNRQKDGDATSWGVNAGERTMAGKNQAGVQVGLRHRF